MATLITFRGRRWVTLLAVVLGSFAGARPLQAQEAAPDVFNRHVAVAQEGLAATIGRDVLRDGGTAVDAAVATAFALAVTHPAAGNIGGGGFIVAYSADTRQVRTFDFRETAPQAATPTMYLGSDGKLLPHHRAGARGAGVPGTVRGLALAHARLGKRPWVDLVKPAVRLARDGFEVSETLARSLNAQLFGPEGEQVNGVVRRRDDLGSNPDRLADFPESVACFRKPDGSRWRAGDQLVQRDLADTLERIAFQGPDEFYTGETAARIARYMETHGGLITRQDLAGYHAVERKPIHTRYRGYDVYGMGPPSSGGIVLAQMLGILETWDLKADGPRSARTLHRVTEAQRRAYFTRATRLADPDVVKVPVEELVAPDHVRNLAATIGEKATPSASLADFPVIGAEGTETTHLSTYDSAGNAVALTYTLEEGYGAKAVVAGAGFLLNNEMGDFNLIPGRTDAAGRIGTEANQIAPGKRMLSSQTPTIVLRNGKVRLVTGSPGGRTIPNTVLWVVLNVLEFGRSPRESINGPRTHHAWFPDVITLEGRGWDASTLDDLRARGHHLKFVDIQGDAQSIVIDPETGQIHGVADTRRVTERAVGD